MDGQIMTPEAWFQRGAAAARENVPRDGHHMNWHAPAVADWQAGHDHVTKARQQHARGLQGRVEP